MTKLERLKADFNDLCIKWADAPCYSIEESKISTKLRDLSNRIDVEIESARGARRAAPES